MICEENIKNINEGKPLMCYQCQKIFHKTCLEDWDNNCKKRKNKFFCPKCKYDLPLKDWKEKVNFEEERKNVAYVLNDLNNEKKIKAFKNILNKINKINLLIDDNKINNIDYNQINEVNKITDKIFEALNITENFVKSKTNSMSDNYIIGVINVKNDNENLRIINTYEQYCKSINAKVKNEDFNNEKEIIYFCKILLKMKVF